MPQKIERVASKALHMGQFIRHFKKKNSKRLLARCNKIPAAAKKSIFTSLVNQACRGKCNLPFLVHELDTFSLEWKNKNFCENYNFESDFFHTRSLKHSNDETRFFTSVFISKNQGGDPPATTFLYGIEQYAFSPWISRRVISFAYTTYTAVFSLCSRKILAPTE